MTRYAARGHGRQSLRRHRRQTPEPVKSAPVSPVSATEGPAACGGRSCSNAPSTLAEQSDRCFLPRPMNPVQSGSTPGFPAAVWARPPNVDGLWCTHPDESTGRPAGYANDRHPGGLTVTTRHSWPRRHPAHGHRAGTLLRAGTSSRAGPLPPPLPPPMPRG